MVGRELAGAFFGKRGETAAVKRDLDKIKHNISEMTHTTETIKAQISGDAWIKQRRLEIKWECYSKVENLGELHTLISEALALASRGPAPGQEKTAFEDQLEDY